MSGITEDRMQQIIRLMIEAVEDGRSPFDRSFLVENDILIWEADAMLNITGMGLLLYWDYRYGRETYKRG